MPGLDASKLPMDLILNIINIVVFFIIVRLLVYKPVKKFMAARTERVNATAKEAQDKIAQANELKAQYDGLLAKGEEKSDEIIKEAQATANAQSAKILAQANKKAEDIVSKSHEKVDEERNEALAAMKNDTVGIALDISEKILARSVTDADNRRIAEDFFDKASK